MNSHTDTTTSSVVSTSSQTLRLSLLDFFFLLE
jgi:hypothetical protein